MCRSDNASRAPSSHAVVAFCLMLSNNSWVLGALNTDDLGSPTMVFFPAIARRAAKHEKFKLLTWKLVSDGTQDDAK